MAKLLVLYHSIHGHIETMAKSVAEGARGVEGVEVALKRAPETMPREALERIGAKLDQEAPEATIAELPDYDAIVFGSPTRFGNMTGQMRTFLDQTGGHWANGALIGRLGSVFTSSATGAGNETTITSFWNTLIHHGFLVVGIPYSAPELTDVSELRGGSPYGAATYAGPDGSRWPSDKELALARFQGKHVAELARKLHG